MTTMKTKVLFITLAFVSAFAFSQKKLADKFFENYAYVKASELYEIVVEKGDSSKHVLTRLGDCYWNNSKSKEAAYWYKKALDNNPKLSEEYLYKYIQTQLSLGNVDEAEKWIAVFKEKTSDKENPFSNVDHLTIYNDLASTEKVFVEVTNMDFNSPYSDFGSYVNNGKFYFASTRKSDTKKVYKWNEEPYLDIYEASISNDSVSGSTLLVSENINTPYHEATIAITNDGKTLYFTRDNLNKREKLNPDKEGTTHLKLYKATLEGNTWKNIEELPFNSELFSTGHPALSPDNKKLFFVSDREGGLGQTDIYYVDIHEDGTYSSPKNMASVNTVGREMFPFVSKDSTFYFSSDGFINLGLLDIYKSDVLKTENAEPENLGAPINSGYDDFAFFTEDNVTGFFSSNREDGKGNDDIYKYVNFECEQLVKGVVINTDTNKPLSEATVQVIDKTGKVVQESTTSEDGTFEFTIECDDTYTILGKKADYKDDYEDVVTNKENKKEHDVQLDLEPLIKDDQIVINPIFFDFDKWNIRTDAQYELENIVDVLREHPNMVIKIESHTDSRGSDKYNMKLSDRRAKSTRDYLVSRGIEENRLESAIGYGESQLLNKCSNGVKCSKEEHQLNRRSYFYIVKY